MHLFRSSSPALDQHFSNEPCIIDSSSTNGSLFRLSSFKVQPRFICSCFNDPTILVWAGRNARPSPRAQVNHLVALKGNPATTAYPVAHLIRINSGQRLSERNQPKLPSSHGKALPSWLSASRLVSRSLCSLSPALRPFAQLNPPMDLRSGSSKSKEDPPDAAQQRSDRILQLHGRIHPYPPLVHRLRTFYGSDGVIRIVTAHHNAVRSIITGPSTSSGSTVTVRSIQKKSVRIQPPSAFTDHQLLSSLLQLQYASAPVGRRAGDVPYASPASASGPTRLPTSCEGITATSPSSVLP